MVKSPHNSEITKDMFAEFFALSFDPMCILQVDGQILALNQAFEKVLEIKNEDNADYRIEQFVHADESALVSAAIKNAYEQKNTQTVAARLRTNTIGYRWFLWKIQAAEEGYLFLVAKDISPFQQLETVDRARSQFAEALLDTVLAVNSSNLSLETVLYRIISNIIKVVIFDHVDILLIEGDTAFFAAMQNSGEAMLLSSELSDFNFHIEDYYYLKLMRETKRPVIVRDIRADNNWSPVSAIDFGGSFLGCPVMLDGEVIAFINVMNLETNVYSSIHARQLLMFANHVAIAINNAYLFEQSEVAAALKERQRLAREFHDSVNQILFSAGTYAKLIPIVMDRKPEKVQEYATKISERIRGALAQLRTILVELHPEGVTETELDILLKQLCNAFTGNTGIQVNLNVFQQIILSKDAQLTYYRIAQESLHNIEKHANATEVSLSLEKEASNLTLRIEDNGRGFNLDKNFVSNYGLKIMHQRAQSIGASLSIESDVGLGTRIILRGKFNDKQ